MALRQVRGKDFARIPESLEIRSLRRFSSGCLRIFTCYLFYKNKLFEQKRALQSRQIREAGHKFFDKKVNEIKQKKRPELLVWRRPQSVLSQAAIQPVLVILNWRTPPYVFRFRRACSLQQALLSTPT